MGFYCTTLNKIREHHPCTEGWSKLLKRLGKTKADDEPVSLKTILESNGLDDALWALRAVDGGEMDMRIFAVRCARKVQHLMEDERSLKALEVSEAYAMGKATDEELAAASAAAWAAASAAASAAARAAAWAVQKELFIEMFCQGDRVMNYDRRMELKAIYSELNTLKKRLEEIKDEEEDAYNNMPESFQNSIKGDYMADRIDNMETALDAVKDALIEIQEAAA